MGVSENSVALNPMVLLIIIPMKMAISLGLLTQHFQTNPYYINIQVCRHTETSY